MITPSPRHVYRPAAMTAGTGLALIAAPCADRLHVAAMHARDGDRESLHELRVSARRLRAALSIFRDVLPRQQRKRLRAALRGVLQVTGPLRDRDVLLEYTLSKAAGRDAADAVALTGVLAAAQARARRRVMKVLAGRRLTRLLAELKHFSTACRSARAIHAEETAMPLRDLAHTVLGRHHRRLRKRARAITRLDSDGLHRLRIRTRAQRYRAELLAGLYPQPAAQRYASALQDLQQRLGAIHDMQTAQTLIAGLATTTRTRPARDRLERHCAKKLAERRARLRNPHLGRGALTPFWK